MTHASKYNLYYLVDTTLYTLTIGILQPPPPQVVFGAHITVDTYLLRPNMSVDQC
jgi:hypothetical protein